MTCNTRISPGWCPIRPTGALSRRSPGVSGIELDRIVINLDCYGNTVAATIPLGLSEWGTTPGRFAYGDRIVLSAFGAGFTAGSIYLRWAIKQP